MTTITLRTESGRWERVVLIQDDPVFSSLIPDLPDMKEGEVITLSGSVAEVIEREWPYYERLLEYIERLRHDAQKEIDKLHRHGEESIPDLDVLAAQPSAMTKMIRSETTVIHHISTPLVYLHQVHHLSRLINMPANWEFFVGVNEETPQVARIHHLNAVGRAVTAIGMAEQNMELVVFSWSHDVIGTLRRIWEYMDENEEIDDKLSIKQFIWGLTRNCLLRTCEEEVRYPVFLSLYWDMVLWQDIEPVIGGLIHPSLNNTANLLAGVGDALSPSYRACECGIVNGNMRVDEINRPLLFHRLISSFPQDVDPIALGLAPIIYAGASNFGVTASNYGHPVMPLGRLVPWMIFNTLLLIPYRRGMPKHSFMPTWEILGSTSLPAKDFPQVVELIGGTLGLRALSRVLLSLLHYSQRLEGSNGKNDRVEKFTSLIEDYLERHEGENREFIQLPEVALIDSIVSVV